MSRRLPAILAALASLVLVVWFVWRDTERLSPGRLSAVHAQEHGLEQRCEACHGEQPNGMALACGECHAAIQASIAARTGLHGQLPQPQACGACHSEHHGEEYRLVSDATFARAGIPDRAAYAHEGLNYKLHGAHEQLTCKQCHPHADDLLLAKGTQRFLGQKQACASCHKDPHRGQLPDCASCHDQSAPFAKAALFEHTASFPLSGAHAGLSCQQCHEPASPRAFEAYASAAAKPSLRACQDCHQSPHRAEFLRALALDCDACHSAEVQGFTAARARLTPAQHAQTGFALTAPHDKLECAQCHKNGLETARAPRKPNDCAACHADPHQGQFAAQQCADCHGGPHFQPSLFDAERHAAAGFALRDAHSRLECKACHRTLDGVQRFKGLGRSCAECHEDVHRGQFPGRSCAQCHNEQHFTPALYTAEQHAQAGFPLLGSHAALDCQACHKERDGVQVFKGTPQDCASCHGDPHQGQFGRSACSECHTEQHFAPSLFDAARHAAAGFALSGAHARVACADCHEKTGQGQLFRGTKSACADCHRDPHAGAFPASKGCAECHQTESFATAAAEFDHARSTGFALLGAHFAIPCEACHRPLPKPDALGRSKSRAQGVNCQDCHSDPHAGQFADARGITSCAQCHRNESDFAITTFDHQTMSRFPLDETHEKLACSACHREVRFANGLSAVRFKPLGTTCGDCHDPRK
jgi:hypothetical protein